MNWKKAQTQIFIRKDKENTSQAQWRTRVVAMSNSMHSEFSLKNSDRDLKVVEFSKTGG
jgi:hypothetical protein